MTALRVLRDRLRALVTPNRVADEIREELEHHLEMRTAEYVRRGLSPEAARLEAQRRVGQLMLLLERGYDVRGGGLFEELLQDVRHTLRLFRKNPGWTAATVATLAIGIGANTAIFSTMRAILLRPLPYDQPERLVMMWRGSRTSPPPIRGVATPTHVLGWKSRNATLADIAVIEQWAGYSQIVGEAGAERLRVSFASTNFFSLLGVRAALGRTFADADADTPNVIVLSDRLWRRRFGADPGAIGRTVNLPIGPGSRRVTKQLTIVGVLPPRFHFTYPEETEAWLPRPWADVRRATQVALMYQVVARLKPGTTLAQAQTDLDNVNAAMGEDQQIPEGFRSAVKESVIRLEPVQEFAVGQTRAALILLTVTTTFLLVVACVNVVSLLLARTAQRARELAVRVAIGAGPRRVARQLFAEGLVLAFFGGLAGLGVAILLQPAVRLLLPAAFPRGDEISIDVASVGWTGLLSAAVAMVAGLAPNWGRSHLDVHGGLKQGGPNATADRAAARWRGVLVAAQVAIVVCLMVGSGLLIRTFWNLQRVDVGFDGRNLLTMEIRHFDQQYLLLRRRHSFEEELLARVRALPNVSQSAVASAVPMGRSAADALVAFTTVAGRNRIHVRAADGEYFSTMRISLQRGRLYETTETRVCVVSESAAKVLFPGEDPIGKTIEAGISLAPAQIIGVVGDVRDRRVDEPGAPAVYAPRQHPQASSALNTGMTLVVRTNENPTHVAAAIRTIVQALDPSQPVEGVATVDQMVSATIADRRFYAIVTAAFSLVALFLAIAGMYGVVTRGVTERVKELGIRMVLGARDADLIRLVLRQGLSPVVAGLAVGGLAAAWLSQLLRRFLFGVQALDPATYLVVPVVVVVIAAAACFVPAFRALRVNPITALRSE